MTQYRYEELADLIAGLVAQGTLLPGSRAPSLRDISRQQRTSLTTALQAYRLLEDRGVLLARPQSGFYVARGAVALPVPATSRPSSKPTEVALPGLMMQMLSTPATRALHRWAARSPARSCLLRASSTVVLRGRRG